MKTRQAYTTTPAETKSQYLAEATEHIRKITNDPKYAEKFFFIIVSPMIRALSATLCDCYNEYIDPMEVADVLYIALWSKGTWERLYSYEGKSSFFSWLKKVAKNEAFRHFDDMGYFRVINDTPGNTRLRLLRQPLEIRKSVVSLVTDPEHHMYLKLRYVDKLSDKAICRKFQYDEETFKELVRDSTKELKSAILKSEEGYADVVLRKTKKNHRNVGEEALAKVAVNTREETDIECYLKTYHGIDYNRNDYEQKFETYIRKNAAHLGLKNENKLNIFIERVVYNVKAEKVATKFNVKRAYVDNIKSKGLKRFNEYVRATCRG